MPVFFRPSREIAEIISFELWPGRPPTWVIVSQNSPPPLSDRPATSSLGTPASSRLSFCAGLLDVRFPRTHRPSDNLEGTS